jgi:hypothetical protein
VLCFSCSSLRHFARMCCVSAWRGFCGVENLNFFLKKFFFFTQRCEREEAGEMSEKVVLRGAENRESGSQPTTPRKTRTPQIAKTAPVPRAGQREEERSGGLDEEVADELLARIEQLESENKKLRKIAMKGKGAAEALRAALHEVERQQRAAALWMAASAAAAARQKGATLSVFVCLFV